jgi:predicted RNA polymerase sigma factor
MRARVIVLAAVLPVVAGCGGVQYSIAASGASSRLEEARALGADQLAPYEYYFAKEHLEQAQVEAAEASYSDAVTLAREAEEHAAVAIELARKAKRVNP